MVSQPIVLKKISLIRTALTKLAKYRSVKLRPFLENEEVQDIVLHNLLVALQATIDLGGHLVSDEGWGVAGRIKRRFRQKMVRVF